MTFYGDGSSSSIPPLSSIRPSALPLNVIDLISWQGTSGAASLPPCLHAFHVPTPSFVHAKEKEGRELRMRDQTHLLHSTSVVSFGVGRPGEMQCEKRQMMGFPPAKQVTTPLRMAHGTAQWFVDQSSSLRLPNDHITQWLTVPVLPKSCELFCGQNHSAGRRGRGDR